MENFHTETGANQIKVIKEDELTLRLGKWPYSHTGKTLRLSRYLTADRYEASPLPFPETLDLTEKVQQPFPMDGNDQYGCCVVEGTEVIAPNANRAYKGKYSGPVVTIETFSGYKLSVTPNHPILTPKGWVKAHLLSEGDDVVSSRFPERVGSSISPDFNEMPTPVEKVMASLDRVSHSSKMPRHIVPRSHYFHGDAKFIQGEIETVGAESFLQNNRKASPLNPESKQSFALSGVLPSIALSTPSHQLQRDGSVGSSATSLMSSRSLSRPSLRGLIGVTKQADLTHRPKMHASPTKGRAQMLDTDPVLYSELVDGCPGLISTDQIVKISNLNWSGHVYDLSTEQNWYIASGIIVHNCTIAAAAHMVQVWSALIGQETVPDPNSVVKMYFTITGGPDVGANENAVLEYWSSNPLFDWAPSTYFACDPKDPSHIKTAASLFGGVYIGLQIPKSAQTQFRAHKPWTVERHSPIEGGHAVNVVGYDSEGLTVVTWGAKQRMTWDFWAAYTDEAWCILPNDWERAPGIDWNLLEADIQLLAGR